jgi:hypothetical protein
MRPTLLSAIAGRIPKEKEKICIVMTNNSKDKKTSLNNQTKKENVYNLKKIKMILLPMEQTE